MKRPLAATMLDLAGAVAGAHAPGIDISRLELDLPIEVEVARRSGRLDFLAELPRWRWTTAFDPLRGRLRVCFVETAE
jgi:hypothetical protein